MKKDEMFGQRQHALNMIEKTLVQAPNEAILAIDKAIDRCKTTALDSTEVINKEILTEERIIKITTILDSWAESKDPELQTRFINAMDRFHNISFKGDMIKIKLEELRLKREMLDRQYDKSTAVPTETVTLIEDISE